MIEQTALMTLCGVTKSVRAVNSTDASYPTRAPTFTEPTGQGGAAAQTTFAIVDFAPKDGAYGQNSVRLEPFGVGADTTTFKMRVLGWKFIRPQNGQTGAGFWSETTLLEVLCTISTGCPAGLTGGCVLGTSFHADTIALVGTSGNDDVTVSILSPADNTPGHLTLAVEGYQKVEVIFDLNSSATSANAFFTIL